MLHNKTVQVKCNVEPSLWPTCVLARHFVWKAMQQFCMGRYSKLVSEEWQAAESFGLERMCARQAVCLAQQPGFPATQLAFTGIHW
jgi:hypothetical protein